MARTNVYGYLLSIKWGTKLIAGLETTGLKIKPNFEEVCLKANGGVPTDDFIDFDAEMSIAGKAIEGDSAEIPKDEVDTLTVTVGATASNNVTITLNAVAVNIAVTSGDTAIQVADKIRLGVYAGWTAGGTAGTNVVVFAKQLPGAVSAPVFAAGSTGVTAAFVRTVTGQDGTSDDYETLREATAAGAEIAFVYGRFVTGEKIVSGTATLRDWSEDAGSKKEKATWSGSMKAKKGTVVFGTY
jgi:hypothetical protein